MYAHSFIRTQFLAVALVAGAAFFAVALPLSAKADLAPAPSPCDVMGRPFLTYTQQISNDPDSGNHGNWALDAFTENVSVWVGTDGSTYCANATTSNGTFVTTGPSSPESGAALASGISGTFSGGENYVLPSTLTLNPIYSTTTVNNITLPPNTCGGDGNACLSGAFSDWVADTFTNADPDGSTYVQTYWLQYVTSNNGTWVDADNNSNGSGGDQGDITNGLFNVYVASTGSDSSGDGSQANPLQTIGAALSAVANGGTIHVGPGTYDAFSIINRSNVSIIGAGAGSTMIAPTALVDSHTGHKYTPDMQVSVLVKDSTGIDLEAMTINDNGHAPGAGGPDALLFWDASTGTVKNSEVAGHYVINGDQTGQGIAVDAGSGETANLTVSSTAISGFQKNGIDIVDGNSLTSNPGTISVDVEGGSITGAGATTTLAQNGVLAWNQGGGAVTAKVNGTAISNLQYLGSDQDVGVYAYGTAGFTTVSNVSFSNVDLYISNGSGSAIDATTGNIFDGVAQSGASKSQLAAIEDKLYGITEDTTTSPIYILPHTLIVTPNNLGIQSAVNSAHANDTILVTPGTYKGEVSITKQLTLQGSGIDQTIIKGPRTGPTGNTLFLNANGIVVDGVTVTRDGNDVADWNSNVENQGVIFGQGKTGIIFRNSKVTGNRNGIYINNAQGNTLTNDIITDNRTGIQFANDISNTAVSGSQITNNWTLGVLFNLVSGVPTTGSNVKISGNTISGNWYGDVVSRSQPNSFDVSGNYFGTASVSATTTDSSEPGYAAQIPVEFGGSATAPASGVSNIEGPGSVYLTYQPWYADADMTSFGYTTANDGVQASTTIATQTTLAGTSTASGVTAVIPAGTTVTGDASWDGVLEAPTLVPSAPAPGISGFNTTVGLAIEVGSNESDLTFDNPVKLIFAGQHGQLIGWYDHAGTFSPIGQACDSATSATVQTVPLAPGADCVYDNGTDLIVWTTHFSTFLTYTATAIPPAPAPATSSGGGGGGIVGLINTTSAPQLGSAIVPAATAASVGSQGQVLGASAYNFANNLSVGSAGEDVTQLQAILIADGYLAISAPTGYFGSLTKAAVMKYQQANGISPVSGFVGPLTRASLDKGSLPTSADENNSLIASLQSQLTALLGQIQALMASSSASLSGTVSATTSAPMIPATTTPASATSSDMTATSSAST